MTLLRKSHGLPLFVLCLLLFGVQADKVSDEEESDSILSDVKYLYEENKHYVDPDDMFLDFDGLRRAAKAQDDPKLEPNHKAPLARESSDAAAYRLELDTCRVQRDLLQKELETLNSATGKLHKKLSREALVDYLPFYRRTLSLLWDSLQLEAALRSVEDGISTGVARQVTLVASAGAVTSLHSCLTDSDAAGGTTLAPRQCDEAVSSLLAGVTVAPEQPGLVVRLWEAVNSWTESAHTLNKLELALLVVAAVFMVLVGLLVRDVIRTRRMETSVMLLLAMAFVFCCLWNWRSMIKEVEARRAAKWEQRGAGNSDAGGGPPSECRDRGFWAWVSGADAECQRYYREAFLSAAEEVSLEDVVSRTAAALFLGPLRVAGREFGHFFKEFYGEVPLLYQLPASLILVVLLLIITGMVLLMTCGCAVNFPFFMGGIRLGGPRNPPPPAINEETVTNKLREEQQQFLLESRRMMLDINAASLVTAQRAQVVQPILTSSFRSIESHLDQLISSRLHSMLQHAPTEASDRLALGPPLTSPSRTPQLSFERLSSAAAQPSSTAAQLYQVSTAGGSPRSAGPQDCPDGSQALPSASGPNSRVLEGGTGSCETSDFYHDVCNALGESFSSSSVGLLEELVSIDAGHVTPPRVRQRVLKTELENDPPLSPASKKFLSEVQQVLES